MCDREKDRETGKKCVREREEERERERESVCVCVRESKREREREKEKEIGNERGGEFCASALEDSFAANWCACV